MSAQQDPGGSLNAGKLFSGKLFSGNPNPGKAKPGKQTHKRRSLNLEQLENRMLCTISGLEQSLLLLNEPLAAPSVSATPANVTLSLAASQLATFINSIGITNTTTSGTSIALAATASRDASAKTLIYNWQATQSPAGSRATFSKNNNNAASSTVFSFNQVGVYQLRLTVTGAGLSVSSTRTVTVIPKVTRIELQSPGNTVQNAGRAISTSAASTGVVAVAYDQFNARITQAPTCTWRSTTVPSGAATTITSASNSATLGFNKVGTYSFEASTSNLTLRFNVNVTQTATSVIVTPGTTSTNTGESKQFTAVALDQFQSPMTTQPRFAWTTTGGTISSSGVFKAPSTAGLYTVTATRGTLNAQATISVAAPTPTTVLNNTTLSNLVTSYFADGSITRPEMIQLLRAAGIDGTVDATELTDLRYLVSNATTYNIADYVKVLASNVVNTNLANNLYQGAAAGNLVAGSTAALLNKLVDKWFLGTDRPTLTSGSYGYQAASGSLFVGAPTYTNEKQGMLGDCYFIAALGSLGVSNADSVRNMFVDNGDGTYTVRFYGGSYGAFYISDGTTSEGFSNGVGFADYVTVDRMLPTSWTGTFAYSNYGANVSNSGNVLWIALAEKAYAQWNATGKSNRTPANTYASIEGGWMSYVNAQVLGYNSTRYASSITGNKTALVNALNAGRAVTVGTTSNASMMVSSHAYSITAYDATSDKFTIFNPWGTQHPAPLTWEQLQANTTFFIVGNPAQSVPIFSSATGGIASVRSESLPLPTGFLAVSPASEMDASWTSRHLVTHEQLTLEDPSNHEAVAVSVESPSSDILQAIELAITELADQDTAPTRDAVDMLFAIDQLDELLSESLSL